MSATAAAPLRARLYRALGRRARILRTVVRIGVAHGSPPLLVGGPVRDLLVRRPVGDIDLVVADGLEGIVREAANTLGARAIIRPRFLTATIQGDGVRLDLSRARREIYTRPGALPTVEPGNLDDDLARRDFTVNSMALPLHDLVGDEIRDPHGGRSDLRSRRLRVLHGLSFRDDPTRVFRAARYAVRFRLAPDRQTSRLLREAVIGRFFDPISGDRIVHELERMLDEPDAAGVARWLARRAVPAAVAEGWSLAAPVPRALRRLSRARRNPPWEGADRTEIRLAAGLRCLLWASPLPSRPGILERLAVTGRRAHGVLQDLRRVPELRSALPHSRRPSSIARRLDPIDESGLLFLWCSLGDRAAAAIRRFARRDRHVAPGIDGNTARRLGARGPEIGALLEAARRRALEGRAVDAAWARRWLARRKG